MTKMICPACQQTDLEPAFTANSLDHQTWTYEHCRHCGYTSMSPHPSDDVLGTYYSADYYGDGSTKFPALVERWINQYRMRKARFVQARIKVPGSIVLDIGCGNGMVLSMMSELGFRAEGVEYPGTAADRASSIPGLHVKEADINELQLPAEKYAAITLWHVLEHLRNPGKTLATCYDALKSGGVLVIDIPNGESIQAQWFKQNWFHLDPPRHLSQFTQRSMESFLTRAGFTQFEMTTAHVDMGLYGFLQSLLNAVQSNRDHLYELIKSRGKESWSRTLFTGALALAATPIALLGCAAETLTHRQAVLRVIATK